MTLQVQSLLKPFNVQAHCLLILQSVPLRGEVVVDLLSSVNTTCEILGTGLAPRKGDRGDQGRCGLLQSFLGTVEGRS